MKIIRLLGSLMLLATLTLSCEKNDNAQPSAQLEGEWTLREVTGGIHGQGYTPDFDLLTLSDGKYTLTKGNVTYSSGTYAFSADVEYGLVFNETQHREGFAQFVDQPKKVDSTTKDVLILADPCCDLYAYKFTRKGVDVE